MVRGMGCVVLGSVILLGAVGCVGVKLSPEDEKVRVSSPQAVEACDRIGRTKARTQAKAWIFNRRAEKVQRELENLARVDAAEMGGTDVAPLGEPEDGRQEFGIYRCPDSAAD